jgi:hypothetical protein
MRVQVVSLTPLGRQAQSAWGGSGIPHPYEQCQVLSGAGRGSPEACGTSAGVSCALLCFVVLWGRFATDIPRARLLEIK